MRTFLLIGAVGGWTKLGRRAVDEKSCNALSTPSSMVTSFASLVSGKLEKPTTGRPGPPGPRWHLGRGHCPASATSDSLTKRPPAARKERLRIASTLVAALQHPQGCSYAHLHADRRLQVWLTASS